MRSAWLGVFVVVGLGAGTARAEPCKGVESCRKACSAGDVTACNTLGLLNGHEDGHEVRVLCRDGSAEACAELRRVRDADPLQTLKSGPSRAGLLERDLASDCRSRKGESCVQLGYLLEARTDFDGAASIYTQACRSKGGVGCKQLSRLRLMQNDPVKGGGVLERNCVDGRDAGACLLLGRAALEGTATSTKPAAWLFERACDQGVAVACGELARIYVDGEGVAIDPLAAADLYGLACERGDAESCLRSAEILDAGAWGPRDAKAAEAARARACSLGYKAIYPDPDPCKK